MRIRKAAFGVAAALAVTLAGGVQATTLADLSGGASLTVGSLTFSDFTITVNGAIDHNLADYTVLTLSDGFKIVGGINVSAGQQGDMLVSYDVSASQGSAVDGMRLAFDGTAVGAHAAATVSEDLFGNPGGNSIASADVFQLGSGLSQKVDAVSFAPQTSFTVEKDILVNGGSAGSPPSDKDDKDKDKKDKDRKDKDRDDDQNGDKDQGQGSWQHRHQGDDFKHHGDDSFKDGGFASISFVDQEFTVVPEPGSLLLLGGGLTGLLAFGRKRKG
jgi:hypothetical protein